MPRKAHERLTAAGIPVTFASASWLGLVRATIDLCRLRGDPADLPHAPLRLAALIVAVTVLDLLIGHLIGDGVNAFARSLLSTGVVLGLCWAALAIRRLRNRYVQTATALLACSLAFSLLQLPLALLAGPPPASAAELSAAQIVLGWLTVGVFVWQVCVDAHIMRHALDAALGLAFALVVSWVLAYWALDSVLF